MEDYKAKLQNLLQEPSIKIIKKKVEYDYSAIFEASRSNIKQRNRTFQPNAEKEKEHKSKVVNNNRKGRGVNG